MYQSSFKIALIFLISKIVTQHLRRGRADEKPVADRRVVG